MTEGEAFAAYWEGLASAPGYSDETKADWRRIARAAWFERAKRNAAVSLTRIGIDTVVALEIHDEWVPVIIENGDVISHIVEPLGIQRAIDRERRGNKVGDWRK